VAHLIGRGVETSMEALMSTVPLTPTTPNSIPSLQVPTAQGLSSAGSDVVPRPDLSPVALAYGWLSLFLTGQWRWKEPHLG
jgi:hypothetical protein